MVASLLLGFREGLEAALIVGIVLGLLRRMGRSDQERYAWLGVGIAALVSVVGALALYTLGATLEGVAEEVFEGVTMLLAAGILTWMIFWMERQGRVMESRLKADIDRAAAGSGSWAIFSVAFFAVVREGIELVLFLTAVSFGQNPSTVLAGAVAGIALAVLAGWLILTGTAQLSLRDFFRVTSLLLIIFAAGLVGRGVHELNEAGIIPEVIAHVWDLNPVLDERSTAGQILQALVGYNANPSLTEVVAYVGYWLSVLVALTRRRT